MYFGAWLCGVGLTNQHTSLLLEIPAILYMIYAGDLLKETGKLGLCAASFLVGFSSYATMPLFAVLYPHRGSWGNVATLGGLVRHFRRADYGSLQLYSGDASTAEGLDERIGAYFNDFATDQGGVLMFTGLMITVVGVGVGLLGKKVQNKKNRR